MYVFWGEEKNQCSATSFNQNADRMMQIHRDNKRVDGFVVVKGSRREFDRAEAGRNRSRWLCCGDGGAGTAGQSRMARYTGLILQQGAMNKTPVWR